MRNKNFGFPRIPGDFFVGIVVILACCTHFFVVQTGGSMKIFQMRQEVRDNFYACAETESVEDLRAELEAELDSNDTPAAETISECLEQLIYVQEYPSYMEEILSASAEDSVSFANFQSEGSYARKNAKKTAKDYQACTSVTVSLGHGGIHAAAAVWEDSLSGLTALIYVLFLLYSHYLSRSSFERILFFSMYRGRRWRAAGQMFQICIQIILFVFAQSFCLAFLSFSLYGGMEDLALSAQSIPALKALRISVSVGEILGIRAGLSAAVFCALACFLWAVLWLADFLAFAALLWGVLAGISWMLYILISPQSKLNLLHYANLWSLIHCETVFSEYRNLDLAVGLVSNGTILAGFAALLFFVGLFGVSYLAGVRELSVGKRLVRVLMSAGRNAVHMLADWERRLSVSGILLEQLLIRRCGILILAVFAGLVVLTYRSDTIRYSPVYQYVLSFISEWQGPLDDDARKALTEWEAQISQWEDEYEQATEDYIVGKITFEEFDKKSIAQELRENQVEACRLITETVDRLERLQGERGVSCWIINPFGYSVLLGEDGWELQGRVCLLLFFFLCLMATGFGAGSRSEWSIWIRTLPGGRDYLRRKQKNCVRCIAALFSLIGSGCSLAYVWKSYSLAGWWAPVWSLEFLENFPLPIPIAAYVLLIFGIRMVFVLLLADIFYEISCFLPIGPSIGLGLGIFVFPGVLSLLNLSVPNFLLIHRLAETAQALASGKMREIVFGLILLSLLDFLLSEAVNGWNKPCFFRKGARNEA